MNAKLVVVQFVGAHGEGTYSTVVRNTDKARAAALVALVDQACGAGRYIPEFAYNSNDVYDVREPYYDEQYGKWLGGVNVVAFELGKIF
jgi:hypothetical protein